MKFGLIPASVVGLILLGSPSQTQAAVTSPLPTDALPPISAPSQASSLTTTIAQVRTLQQQGYYRRAKQLLTQTQAQLANQPDSYDKLLSLLHLGNVLRMMGDRQTSQTVLEQALAISERLSQPQAVALASFHLANTLAAQQKRTEALKLYTAASRADSPVRLTALLRSLRLLLENHQWEAGQAYLEKIQAELPQAEHSSLSIYAHLELAGILQYGQSLGFLQPITANHVGANAFLPSHLLATAIQKARLAHDLRAESIGLGRLSGLYEAQERWPEAQQLTEQALELAEHLNAPDLIYQWQWQMGRIRRAQRDAKSAIGYYRSAIQNLQTIRQDLAAIDTEVQFSFRDQVEPVYREFVELLIDTTEQSQTKTVNSDPRIHSGKSIDSGKGRASGKGRDSGIGEDFLHEAQQVIESLQLAELTDYFREACLDFKATTADRVDPQAAIIYPIILSNRLTVIVSIPGQPLQHYSTVLPQAQIETTLDRFRQSMRSTSFRQERLTVAKTLYQWLIQPSLSHLKQHDIKTLIFVPDGTLRNVPMAALHDGQQYLIEQFGVGVTPTLKVLASPPNPSELGPVLAAGLSQGAPNYTPLPGVRTELEQIQRITHSHILLDQSFTKEQIQTLLETQPISIVHLATHGQFSSRSEDTYLLTVDGPLRLQDLDRSLRKRELKNLLPLDLLVLSACETAQGDRRAVLGLAGIAVRSGARSTLASLWTVNDRSTAQFMDHFYRVLQQSHVSRAEAVRQAQLTLLKQDLYSHPYYWAAFTLVGNWQ
ncbi:CHAT domain-containing protein [Alkalinema pantanalense CENA528]|uniref:CHAT domain-containing protein n=1 Tax=Alkalinema pantanalense TaxID=1620705 RepID=UPI003D6E9F7F